MVSPLDPLGQFVGGPRGCPAGRNCPERQPGCRYSGARAGCAQQTAQSGGGRQSVRQLFVLDHLSVGQNGGRIVRVRGNSVFYERPKPRKEGQRGAPAKHGARFKLSTSTRPADRIETFQLGQQTVMLSAWQGLHLKKLPSLVGLVLRVQFLRADGTPRYQRPMWLFWTGPDTVALKDLCCMYLWRFAIEHFFRFAKQHLGLNANQSTQTVSTDHWMWLCALAFWQLLLMREGVEMAVPAWYPQAAKREAAKCTPGQVQRAAFGYLLKLGSPARAPRLAGKGKGRSKGVQPPPRRRFPVVKKTKIASDCASPGP